MWTPETFRNRFRRREFPDADWGLSRIVHDRMLPFSRVPASGGEKVRQKNWANVQEDWEKNSSEAAVCIESAILPSIDLKNFKWSNHDRKRERERDIEQHVLALGAVVVLAVRAREQFV